MEEKKAPSKLREIDFGKITSKIWKHKKLFIINMLVAGVVSFGLILCVPRYYTCEVKLAPETSNPSMGGNLSSLASSFGINMGNLTSQDAIVPELYPDLMESVDFCTSMFTVQVQTKDGSVKTNYFDYLTKHQKAAWWEKLIMGAMSIFKSKPEGSTSGDSVNSFQLSRVQSEVAEGIKHSVSCSVDKKTDVITITVTDQDPLVCATIADSARVKLQDAIIKYRTSKARVDLDYARGLNEKAHKEYDEARQRYAAFYDTHQDLVLKSVESEVEDLENDMQLKYNAYQQTVTQVQLAAAKLQERTPAFTLLQSATVPIKPAGPKRMIFALFWMFVAFAGTLLYVYKKKKDE